jgi:hypothetical protein
MKTTGTFKTSWFLFAIVVAIVIGEIIAWEAANHFGLRNNPLVVAVMATGLVAAFVSVLYEGIDIG